MVSKQATRDMNARVLLVEAEPLLLSLYARMLQKLHYSATAFQNGKEALEKITFEPAHYDLLLTDQHMPGLTGRELAREMRRIRPNLPVVIMTGHSAALTPTALREAGIQGLLKKPFDLDELAETVATVLHAAQAEASTT